MNDDRKLEGEERSWLDRLTHFISGEPQTKSDLEDVLSLAEALEIIDAGHSRFPVIGDGIDDVIGILLAKDLLPLVESDSAPPALRELMRPVTAVPESKRLNVLLREFRQNRNHMAIVIDEYGGIAGLITIEDVLEEIVGEIEDETDVAEKKPIRPMNDGSFFVEALTAIDDFNAFFDTEFSDDEFDTIGGVVVNAFGQLPSRNQSIQLNDFEFSVIRADERRLSSLRVRPVTDIDSGE